MRNLFRSLVACSVISAIALAGYAQNTAEPGTKVEPRPKQNTPNLKREKNNQNTNQEQNQNTTQNQTQDDAQPGRDERTQQADARGGRGALDRYAAACAINENENEVTIAQLAQKKARNPEVKAFAEMLVKDHTAFIEKLRPFEGGQPRRDGAANRREQRQEGATRIEQRLGQVAAPRTDAQPQDAGTEATQNDANRPASPRVAQNEPQIQTQRRDGRPAGQMHQRMGAIPVGTLVQISDEIAKRCLASAQRELSSKDGEEFDRCFIGMQVGAHSKMVDALSVVQNHVSPELQQILSDGVETSQRHLTEAKKLHENLEKTHAQTAGAEKEKRQ
ncbi:MAG: DUF4142 domain-containing protein [Planctomycetaceae bacterium]